MAEDWQKIEAKKAEGVISTVNPYLTPAPFTVGKTTVRVQKLPFYRTYDLYEMTDHATVPAARKYALFGGNDVVVIDWTNQPIYDINEKAPIVLTEDNVVSYVKFFFNYVRGRRGRFQLIESVDDIRWQVEPPLQGRKIMQDMLEPVTLIAHDSDGTFHLEGFMIFKDSLFKTRIHIKKDGLISMSEEELKIEGLPVIQDAA